MRVLVHVGYPKSMSTYYQENVFPHFAGVEYMGLFPSNNVGDRPKKLTDREYRLNSILSEILVNEIRPEDIRDRLEVFLQGKDLIISYERILSPFFNEMSFKDAVTRINEIFSEVDLTYLVLYRNLREFVISQYREQPFIFYGVRKKYVSMDLWFEYYINKGLLVSRDAMDSIIGKDLYISHMTSKERVVQSICDYFDTRFTGNLEDIGSNVGVSHTAFLLRRISLLRGLGRIFPRRIRQFIIYTLNTGNSKKILVPKSVELLLNEYEKNWYTTPK